MVAPDSAPDMYMYMLKQENAANCEGMYRGLRSKNGNELPRSCDGSYTSYDYIELYRADLSGNSQGPHFMR